MAFLVVTALVYYFGSSGTYLLRTILISPEVLEKVSFTRSDSKFVFNKIEFVRAHSQGKGWGRFGVSVQSYAEFYKKVANERSLPVLTDEMLQQFKWITPSTLTISVRARDAEAIFQQVQFLDQGDIFRVQLHRDRQQEEWVYFSYPGIYKIVTELFSPELKNEK